MFRLILFLVFAFPLLADEEMANRPYVMAGTFGHCYAKTVPSGSSGQLGTTKVYKVEMGEDTLVHTFDWYSSEIYLLCGVGPKYTASVVRMGPWARGQYANADDLAIAFYYDGKLVRRYSTELAGSTANVSRSTSHYRVIERVEGYRSTSSNPNVFELTTQDGRRLRFDPITGELVATERTAKQ